jgi:hypothetical protein
MNMSTYRFRILLLLALMVSVGFYWLLGSLLGIPVFRGYDASLLRQPAPVLVLVVVAVGVAASAAVGTILTGGSRLEAGVFTAAFGMCALSLRGGPMRHTLLDAASPSVFPLLAIEVVLLFAMLGVVWRVMLMLRRQGMLQKDEFQEGIEDQDEPLSQRLLALAMQVVMMGVLMLILSQTDQKLQVLAAVGISSWAATALSWQIFPTRASVWYWTGPLLVAMAGYLMAWWSPDGWQIGLVPHALARPLPLDYVSFGVPGALLAHWAYARHQPADEPVSAAAAQGS